MLHHLKTKKRFENKFGCLEKVGSKCDFYETESRFYNGTSGAIDAVCVRNAGCWRTGEKLKYDTNRTEEHGFHCNVLLRVGVNSQPKRVANPNSQIGERGKRMFPI
jgi:hypothetical protein